MSAIFNIIGFVILVWVFYQYFTNGIWLETSAFWGVICYIVADLKDIKDKLEE